MRVINDIAILATIGFFMTAISMVFVEHAYQYDAKIAMGIFACTAIACKLYTVFKKPTTL